MSRLQIARAGSILGAMVVSGVCSAQVSSFETSAEGWSAVTFATTAFSGAPATSHAVTWSPTGGNPLGNVSIEDPNANWTYFSAPAPFLGNKSASIGTDFTYSLRTVGGTFNNYPEAAVVILKSPTLSIGYFGPAPISPGAWTPFIVPLSTSSAWRYNSQSGATVTAFDFQQVLSNLTALYLKAEYATTVAEVVSLDQPQLLPLDNSTVFGTVDFGQLTAAYNTGLNLPTSIPVSFRDASNTEIATGSATYDPVTGAFSAAVPGAVTVPFRVSFKQGFWLRKTMPNPADPAAPLGNYNFGTVTPLVGDSDDDNDITNGDYALWAAANGNSVTPNTDNDFDGDGDITNGDYALWAANNGNSGDI